MIRNTLLRLAAYALAFHGVLGLFVVAGLLVVGTAVMIEVDRTRVVLEQERAAVVTSLRSLSRTFGDAASATTNVRHGLDGAYGSADTAVTLSTDAAATFRGIAQGLQVELFGMQPFGTASAQFTESAGQLDRLAGTLAQTRDALRTSTGDVTRVGRDLADVQRQVAGLADSFERSSLLAGPTAAQMALLRLTFYGACLLFGLQSVFSLVAGFALARYVGTLVERTRPRLVPAVDQAETLPVIGEAARRPPRAVGGRG